MDLFTDTTFWLVAGISLVAAELIIPGGIVVFLGGGCLIVAGALSVGLVSTWTGALTLFFISSLLLILALRSIALRFAGGDYSLGNTVEILDDVGHRVKVIDSIGPGNKVGRIEFRGTQWPAVGDGSEIVPGEYARIVSRENVSYVVERFSSPGNSQS